MLNVLLESVFALRQIIATVLAVVVAGIVLLFLWFLIKTIRDRYKYSNESLPTLAEIGMEPATEETDEKEDDDGPSMFEMDDDVSGGDASMQAILRDARVESSSSPRRARKTFFNKNR